MHATRIGLGLLVVLTVAMPAQAEGRRRSFLRFGEWGQRAAARRMADGRREVAYRVQPVAPAAAAEYRLAAYDAAPMPVEAAVYQPAEAAAPVAPTEDPLGFVGALNQYRASAGLPPLAVDANLSAWASQNNAVQAARGIGHHVVPNCVQNCGWNYSNAWGVLQGWINSPGHRQNLLNPWIRRVGIAYGPGPYWTMNAL
jgi:uncharacterized protein YkwD